MCYNGIQMVKDAGNQCRDNENNREKRKARMKVNIEQKGVI